MRELLRKSEFLSPPKIGEIIKGRIIAKGRAAIFLDLGAMGTGIIYGREFYEAREELKKIKVGDEIFAKVIDLDNEEGYIELSASGASREMAFEILKQKKESGEIMKVKISGANKGGLLAEVSGIPAFLPVSQLSSEHYPRVEGRTTKIIQALQKFIGKELEVKIFDLSPKNGQVILSEKARILERAREILKNYKVGDIIKGEITAITDFGAFIRFGQNLEGLIHISELDWKIIHDPSEVVKVGEKVKAKIIDILNGKVSLSLKALKKK